MSLYKNKEGQLMDIKDNQKDYWNKVAADKKFSTPFQIKLFSEVVSKEARILDVGCGYGRILNGLYFEGFKNIYGIDFSNNMIERGRAQFPYLNLKVQESSKIPYEDNSFDSIILFAVLTCIIEDLSQTQLLKEIKRVLSQEAYCI